jgi:hypothetical protein
MAKRYTNPTNIAGKYDIQTEYFASTVHKNGRKLEERVEEYLKANFIQFKKNIHNGIDFVIDGAIYLDCVATSQSGSIDDKLPTKCFKYIRKYNLSEIFILHPYSPIEKNVAEHLEHLEKTLNVAIHLLDWNDFVYITSGNKFETRKPYRITRNGAGVKNCKVGINKVNQFFKFNK